MRDQFVDGAIRRILARRRDDGPGFCPDANHLAAYLEGRLTSGETSRYEEHASRCAVCQEALALSLKLAETEAGTAGKTVHEPWRFSFRSSQVRLALAASLVLMVGVLLYRVTRETHLLPPEAQIASQEQKGDLSGGASGSLSTRQEIEAAPRAGAKVLPKESSSAAKVPMLERAGGQPIQPPAAPANIPAPAPILVLDAAASARPQAVADLKAEAGKPAIGEAGEDLLKTQRTQLDAQALRMKMAAVRSDEIKAQAATLGGLNVDKTGRGGGGQALLVQGGAERIPAQAMNIATDSRSQRGGAEAGLSLAEIRARPESLKRIGDRVFWRALSCWVEAECMLRNEMPVRQIGRDSIEYADIIAREPALAGLPAGIPVMLYWNGTKLLIR